jgi:hypothetical protein
MQVAHRRRCGRRRDFSVAHATVKYRGLQTLDGHTDVGAIRDLGGSPGVRQRHLGMGDQYRGVTHATMSDRLAAVIHGHADVDGSLEARQARVGHSGRDRGMIHVSVCNGVRQAGNRGHGVGIVSRGGLGVSQGHVCVLDQYRSMAHCAVSGGLLSMVDGLRKVIILGPSGLDREHEKCGSGH